MKKLLVLLCTLGIAQPAMAASITTLGTLGQAEFRTLSEDLGAALSYKPVTPAAPLGTTGFDIGVEVTQTDMSKSSQAWSKATNGGSTISKLYVPKLHVAKGLPFGIDVAAFYSKIPTTNISLCGGELRYAILDGGLAIPAIGNPRFLHQAERRGSAVAGYQGAGYLHLQGLRHVHPLCRHRSGLGQQHGECH